MAAATGYVGQGDRVIMTAPSGGYVNKEVIVVRSGATGMIGVALAAAAASATVAVAITGVWTFPKATGSVNAMSVGDIAYWDTGTGDMQKVASANIKAGIVVEAALAADTTCKIKLIPSKD